MKCVRPEMMFATIRNVVLLLDPRRTASAANRMITRIGTQEMK